MTIHIRLATQDDLLQLVDMQESHREEVNAYDFMKFNRELCIENMKVFISHPLHIILVATDRITNKLLGYTWLIIYQPHYSYDFYLSEVYTYVSISLRKSSVLARLISKSKVISLNMGAKCLQFGSFSGNKKLSQAYHKRYKLMGEVFQII